MPRVSKKQVKSGMGFLKWLFGTENGHSLIGGVGLPLMNDYAMSDEKGAIPGWVTIRDIATGKFDKWRGIDLVINAGLGAGTGASWKKHKAISAGLMGTAVGKDFVYKHMNTPNRLIDAMNNQAAANKAQAAASEKMRDVVKWLGIGALGLGGFGLIKALKNKKKKDGAKMKVKLPGKKGEIGTEAEVEIPIDMPKMPTNMTEGLDRAVRFRTRKSIQANSMKRDPMTGKLIPYDEWKEKYGRGMMMGQGVPPQMQAQLEKSSGTREFHEHVGDLLFRGAGAVGGMLGGGFLAQKFGKDPLMGAIPGVVLGGLIQPLLGRVTASFAGKRDKEEQEEHDDEDPLGEYILPGYAQHQMIQRQNALKDQIASSSYDATGEDFPPSFAGAGDWDKDASAGPPGGPPPGGGGGGGKPPDPRLTRKVDPNQNKAGQGLPKAGDLKKVRDTAGRALTSVHVAAERPQPEPRPRPQSLADISATMQGVGDTLNRISANRFSGGLGEGIAYNQQNYA